ncbi:MAG: cob(I)yrinic acid a,c-diamide adenosyltransferase [Pyrinomonadaceae bacterium]
MSSIATKHGDTGKTGLIGGERVSKADARVEGYGTIDELGATMGFARSICGDAEINELTKQIQRELFAVAGAVANPQASEREPAYVTQEMVDALTAHVHRIEGIEGILSDWALPGDVSSAAAFDIARTVCRRAERSVIRVAEASEDVGGANTIAYLNRLSDLLWLIGRLLELRAGVDSHLRDEAHRGANWSRAW